MIAIAAFLPNRRRRAMLLSALVLTLLGARPSTAADSAVRTFSSPEEDVQALAAAGKGRRHQGSARYPG